MKRILSLVLCTILALGAFGLVGCSLNGGNGDGGNSSASIKIVMPDGAPALSMAKLMKDDMQFGNDVNYQVVAAADVKSFITGSGEKADIALVPVNLASLLLGQGSEYKMVASVTHGNLYLLSKNYKDNLTVDNASEMLKGKTVAVVNIAAVPGLTAKATLNKLNIPFVTEESAKNGDNVFLRPVATGEQPADLLMQGVADYVIAPEPAVSKITTDHPAVAKVGALHELYGKYPQAVMVVKSSLLESNAKLVEDIFDAMVENQTWIAGNPADAATAVASKLTEGVTPTFNATSITESAVVGRGINVVSMNAEAIAEINGYIADIMPLGGETPVAKAFSENFFVDIKA